MHSNAENSKKPEVYSAIEGKDVGLPTKTKRDNFEWVSDDQLSLVTQRLALIETIMKKHRRAYDYRSLTRAELKTILDALDHDHEPVPVK